MRVQRTRNNMRGRVGCVLAIKLRTKRYITGKCDCEHNTAGDQCERCRSGFYGDPLKANNTEEACKKCPCKFDEADCEQIGDEVWCRNCPEGYVRKSLSLVVQ